MRPGPGAPSATNRVVFRGYLIDWRVPDPEQEEKLIVLEKQQLEGANSVAEKQSAVGVANVNVVANVGNVNVVANANGNVNVVVNPGQRDSNGSTVNNASATLSNNNLASGGDTGVGNIGGSSSLSLLATGPGRSSESRNLLLPSGSGATTLGDNMKVTNANNSAKHSEEMTTLLGSLGSGSSSSSANGGSNTNIMNTSAFIDGLHNGPSRQDLEDNMPLGTSAVTPVVSQDFDVVTAGVMGKGNSKDANFINNKQGGGLLGLNNNKHGDLLAGTSLGSSSGGNSNNNNNNTANGTLAMSSHHNNMRDNTQQMSNTNSSNVNNSNKGGKYNNNNAGPGGGAPYSGGKGGNLALEPLPPNMVRSIDKAGLLQKIMGKKGYSKPQALWERGIMTQLEGQKNYAHLVSGLELLKGGIFEPGAEAHETLMARYNAMGEEARYNASALADAALASDSKGNKHVNNVDNNNMAVSQANGGKMINPNGAAAAAAALEKTNNLKKKMRK